MKRPSELNNLSLQLYFSNMNPVQKPNALSYGEFLFGMTLSH